MNEQKRNNIRHVFCFALLITACSPSPILDPPSPPPFQPESETEAVPLPRLPQHGAKSWPEADLLFHADPRWLGSDGAYSIDLGGGRVLWLFGDTLIAMSNAYRRSESAMVRNSIAIQRGYDPLTASIKFYWRGSGGIGNGATPSSFFPEAGGHWFWPGTGALLGGKLLLFMGELRASSGGLGFEAAGSRAIVIENPDAEPPDWSWRPVIVPENNFGVQTGIGGVMAHGGYVYAYSAVEFGWHDICLARWTAEAAERGDLSAPEWRNGNAGWLPQTALAAMPEPVFLAGQTEFTVHYDIHSRSFIAVQVVGFGATDINFRAAPAPEGPWSPPFPVYHPPEYGNEGIMIYAANSHPELMGADIVITYSTNNFDFATVIADNDSYYPRFARWWW